MSTTSHRAAPPPDFRVGDYRLLTKIGEGGMGVVHLAQAPDGRRVALKVLRPHIIGDDEARARLAQEVSSLGRVRSPRIAEIVDADPWGETPFVATRYVPGLSLHEHLRDEGPVAGADLRWFAVGLAEALVAVHEVGVLHRDVKPSNVLLEGRSPVLIDFGLARLADDPRLTVTGWLLGTPGYLAPEILYGEDATTAADVHSWAATVAFAATGRPPFGRGPAMAIMDRVRRGEHDLSGVPGDLLPLLRGCLAPDPADRPGTAQLMAELGGPTTPEPAGPHGAAGPADELTMPYAVAGPPDADATEMFGADDPAGRVDALTRAQTAAATPADPAAAPAPTTPLTVPGAADPHQASRAPYMAPPPPREQQPSPARPQVDPEAWRPAPGGVSGVQRGALLLGLFGLVSAGFAWAPYVSFLALAVTVLVARTLSWTLDSRSNRTLLRGRRWYDAPLVLLSLPWYLLVATGGTLMLLVWSASAALLAGVGFLLFRLPLEAGLLTMGAALALSLWWGPGSRRVRRPTRQMVVRATRRAPSGWVAVALLAAAVGLCVWGLLTGGVVWDPQPGAPWRAGTLLGDVRGWLR